MQLDAIRDSARQRGWNIVVEVEDVEDVGSGAVLLQKRKELPAAARRRDIDLVVVWRLDRWGGSLADLVNTLQELVSLKVGFVSLSEGLELTPESGPRSQGYWLLLLSSNASESRTALRRPKRELGDLPSRSIRLQEPPARPRGNEY